MSLARDLLEKIVADIPTIESEYLDRKAPKKVAAIARGTELPYFYIDFATDRAYQANYSTNLRSYPTHTRLFLTMLEIFISTEGTRWHLSNMTTVKASDGPVQ
jgi:hypothetical protein